MVKMVALYRRPADVQAFLAHYEQVHLPLVRQMPGLVRLEVSRLFHPRGGSANPFLLTEMYFDTRESLFAAMDSEAGRKSGEDLRAFAGDLVQIYFADVEGEVL
ncbi:EthD family reductase [Alicyclobacillus kakegawensis]|uniref:EthD family reductase n=1 Tax=Alicyclobacillus kakegawensis TaxID=392012 RepID=UPI00082B8BD3|nr:EthD family reductase [Alicyclobacillus kakegawensis]